jgi:hypothetical protein
MGFLMERLLFWQGHGTLDANGRAAPLDRGESVWGQGTSNMAPDTPDRHVLYSQTRFHSCIILIEALERCKDIRFPTPGHFRTQKGGRADADGGEAIVGRSMSAGYSGELPTDPITASTTVCRDCDATQGYAGNSSVGAMFIQISKTLKQHHTVT